MMPRSVLRALASASVLVCVFATAGDAQTAPAGKQKASESKPDFSGTWTRDVKRSESPLTGASTIVIEQSGNELTTRPARDHARVERYRLDGSESVNEESDGTKSKSTVRWDGEKLIVTTAVTPLTGKPYTRRTAYSVTSGGKQLITETATVSSAGKPLHFKQMWVRQEK
jgi:hypothetical protein